MKIVEAYGVNEIYKLHHNNNTLIKIIKAKKVITKYNCH